MIDWDEVVRREGPVVWRTIYRLVRNRADADECLQETFVAAHQFSQREAIDCLPAVLKRFAVARAVDCLRRRSRHRRREQSLEVVASTAAGPSAQAEVAELADELRWALARIPARSAEVFCLCELEDWSYSDIGQQFGLSINAVGALIHRTRRRLQKILIAKKRDLA